MKSIPLFSALAISLSFMAQAQPTTVTSATTNWTVGNPPGGVGVACGNSNQGYLTTLGQIVTCDNGVWTVFSLLGGLAGVPTSATFLGSNSSRQLISATPQASTLTDASTVAWSATPVSFLAVLNLTAIAGNTRLLAVTVSIAGHYAVELFQPVGAGQSITLTCNSNPFKIGNGGAGVVTLTNTANAMDKLTFDYDGANCSGGLVPNFN